MFLNIKFDTKYETCCNTGIDYDADLMSATSPFIATIAIGGLFILSKTYKESSTPREQIQHLVAKGLIIENAGKTDTLLKSVGYHTIINSYRQPFLQENGDFIKGTSFEDIYAISKFDKLHRRIIQNFTEDVEQQLSQIACRSFLEVYGDDPEKYLNQKNYRKIKSEKAKKLFFKNLRYPALYDDSNPFRHYREKYTGVPLWISMTKWDLGTLIHFIKFQKTKVKLMIFQEFFTDGVYDALSKDDEWQTFFSSYLALLLKFRNRSSHGHRLYNYHPREINRSESKERPIFNRYDQFDVMLGTNQERYKEGYFQGDIYTLVLFSHLLEYRSPIAKLKNDSLDNIFKLLHKKPELDFFIFNSLGYTPESIAKLVNLSIKRNQILIDANKSQITSAYCYTDIQLENDSVYVSPDLLPAGFLNKL